MVGAGPERVEAPSSSARGARSSIPHAPLRRALLDSMTTPPGPSSSTAVPRDEMGGSSHRRSASPEYELDAFEFFTIILSSLVSATRQRLPDAFMKMLGEDPPDNVKLRQAGSGVRRLWDMELVIEEGHMYLWRGWEKFYSAYGLLSGYFLLLRYDDDATMLIVKIFNKTMCRMRYADDEDPSNESSSSDTGYSKSSSDYGFSESSTESDNKKDDPDWSGGEEEQISVDEELQNDDGHQADDDLALVVADQGQEVVVADDDLAMVVTVLQPPPPPIVVEDYIPLPQLPPPPRRSWRIRLRKEKAHRQI